MNKNIFLFHLNIPTLMQQKEMFICLHFIIIKIQVTFVNSFTDARHIHVSRKKKSRFS